MTTCRNTLQHTATHCNTMQHTATLCTNRCCVYVDAFWLVFCIYVGVTMQGVLYSWGQVACSYIQDIVCSLHLYSCGDVASSCIEYTVCTSRTASSCRVCRYAFMYERMCVLCMHACMHTCTCVCITYTSKKYHNVIKIIRSTAQMQSDSIYIFPHTHSSTTTISSWGCG